MEADASDRPSPLVVMTLNLQYFASYPKDEVAARERLQEVMGGDKPPDVICVQEGLASKDVLSPIGFELKVCAGAQGHAQTVYEMVYGDEPTLRGCHETLHSELLCNQIYMRRESEWTVADHGVMQISSDLQLVGGGGRAQGKLAIRSMVWVKLQKGSLPAVYVMCTHFTGGRFEDQYFVQQLAEERFHQPDRIFHFFEKLRPNAQADDIGILLGDFNATSDYVPGGPMSGYFKAQISSSAGVQADADAGNVQSDRLEDFFKAYMISPFTAINKRGWSLAYGPEIGITSGFGHLIDHMATHRPLQVDEAKVIYLTNQKFGNKPPDTTLPLTDHNSVKTTFMISVGEHGTQRSKRALLAIGLGMGLMALVTALRFKLSPGVTA
jgi:endonuclease/exonuclease/phosphatase family metal-dependent hydrolase